MSNNFQKARFLSRNDDLETEYCGFLIQPRVDSYGRINISVILPADSDCLEPPRKRGWKRLLLSWQRRAKAYNDETGASEKYLAFTRTLWPAPLVSWIERYDWGHGYGQSYQELCDELNKSICQLLYDAFSTRNDESEQWRVIAKSQFEQARYVMEFFNVSRNDQDNWIEEAGKRFQKGLPLVDTIERSHRGGIARRPGGPINRDAVIAKVRHLRKLHPILLSKL